MLILGISLHLVTINSKRVYKMKHKNILKNIIGLFVFVFLTLLASQSVSAATIDLKSYYPNPDLMNNYYLEGFNNRIEGSPERAVLWFGSVDGDPDAFKQYNNAPEDAQKDCHWDLLSWEGDELNYKETYDGCDTNDKDVTFSTPIQLLPRYWNDTASWTTSGSTTQTTTKLDGSTGCTGVNTWTATILGYVTVSPGVQAIHYRTEQAVHWDTGDDFPYCVADSDLTWQEDYYLVDNIAVTDYEGVTSAPGLFRTVGGNLDNFANSGLYDWDITMTNWELLPWADPLAVVEEEVPGVPDAGQKKPLDTRYTFILIATLLSFGTATTLIIRKFQRK